MVSVESAGTTERIVARSLFRVRRAGSGTLARYSSTVFGAPAPWAGVPFPDFVFFMPGNDTRASTSYPSSFPISDSQFQISDAGRRQGFIRALRLKNKSFGALISALDAAKPRDLVLQGVEPVGRLRRMGVAGGALGGFHRTDVHVVRRSEL